jgi:uncharacterized protein YqgC (DUF456 family)
MDTAYHAVGLALLGVSCAVGLASLVLGLPGTFLILAAAALYAWLTGFQAVTWGTLGWLTALCLTGETLELFSGAIGTREESPSTRTMIWTIVGGFIGGIVGAPFLFGIGSLFGALAGAFSGAAFAVHSEGADSRTALRTGLVAMRGRFLGLVAKLSIAVVMIVVVFVAAL